MPSGSLASSNRLKQTKIATHTRNANVTRKGHFRTPFADRVIMMKKKVQTKNPSLSISRPKSERHMRASAVRSVISLPGLVVSRVDALIDLTIMMSEKRPTIVPVSMGKNPGPGRPSLPIPRFRAP